MKPLDCTQQLEDDEPKASKAPGEPRRYKVIAAGSFTTRPAHKGQGITKIGTGSSQRTAATDALDRMFKDDRLKGSRNKLPLKVVFQIGD